MLRITRQHASRLARSGAFPGARRAGRGVGIWLVPVADVLERRARGTREEITA